MLGYKALHFLPYSLNLVYVQKGPVSSRMTKEIWRAVKKLLLLFQKSCSNETELGPTDKGCSPPTIPSPKLLGVTLPTNHSYKCTTFQASMIEGDLKTG